MRILALIALALLPLTGCVSGSTAPDFHVRIDFMVGEDGNGYGHGILLDAHTVVTVHHVAPDDGHYLVSRAAYAGNAPRYVRADYVRSYGVGRSFEPLTVLKLRKGMSCSTYPEFRGIEPGDSGSPIMGKRGAVVGLISGYVQNNPFFLGRTSLGTNGPVGPTPRTKPKKRPKKKAK